MTQSSADRECNVTSPLQPEKGSGAGQSPAVDTHCEHVGGGGAAATGACLKVTAPGPSENGLEQHT